MSDLGYYTQLEGGIFGQPDGPPLEGIRAIQEAAALTASDLAHSPGAVPQCYLHPGGGNLPIIGWTCQNSTGSPFRPYYAEHIGRIPDYEGTGALGVGAYDMNQVVAYGDNNPLSQAPIGDGLLQFDDSHRNPTSVPRDDQSLVMGYEY